MSTFIDNIPNKKSTNFTPLNNLIRPTDSYYSWSMTDKEINNIHDINKMIEGFELIDNDDLEYSSYTTRSTYKPDKKNRHVKFLPSSLNEKIDALIKKEISVDKPEQYVVLAKNDNETDNLLLDDEKKLLDNTDKNQKDSKKGPNDESSKKNIKTMGFFTSFYVGSLTIVALLLVYRFIQKSR